MRVLPLFFIIVSLYEGFGQQKNIPLNFQFGIFTETQLNHTKNTIHTGIRPIPESDLNIDSLHSAENEHYNRKERTKLIGRKIKQENLIIGNQDNFIFTIDPLMYLETGREQSELPDTQNLFINTRGIMVQGDIRKKVSFMTSFYESQAFFPSYITRYANENGEKVIGFGLIPGQGRAKNYKNGGFDYGMSSAYLSYSPSGYLNFQFGHGKNFIGEGYRSLLLSDNAFNYPHLKITSKIGKKKKIQYTNIFCSLLSIERVPVTISVEPQFKRKGATFQYLSWSPFSGLQLGLFEGTIWQLWEDSTGSQPFNPMQVNPIIGVNTLFNGFSGINNSLLGANIKITPVNYVTLYGQFSFDDRDKHGYQMGLKVYDFAGLIKNLSLRAEYNRVNPYTYSHPTPLQNYAHFGQALAHPYGASFAEIVGIVNYRYRDLFVQLKGIWSNSTEYLTTSGISGQNIFIPDENIENNSALTFINKVKYYDIHLGYLINPKTNLNIIAGYTHRESGTQNPNLSPAYSEYFYLALKTSLRNIYYDF